MKKSVIKRRKRIIPAASGAQASPNLDPASTSIGSPESDRPSPPPEDHRGTMNPDGSVNLGFRGRGLPAPIATSRPSNGQQTSDLTAYASGNQSHHEHPDSLNNENRLPPMTSYPSPGHRRPSVSPNSFLSPSTRKRSFSATDFEPQPSDPSSQPKRLSSIKSILNPGFPDDNNSDIDPALRRNYYSNSPSNAPFDAAEAERRKAERREMLQREADNMREALKAKERELAELGMGE